MLQKGLIDLLSADAGIQSFIGTPATRKDKTLGVFPVQSKQNSDASQIVYSQISGNTVPMLEGAGNLQPCRIQFSCYGQTYEDAKGLARAVKKLLVGMNTTFPDGVRVDYCSLALELDGYEEAPGLYNVPIDLEFLFADTDAS